MTNRTKRVFQLAPVAAALVVAFGSVHAQQSDEVKDLITPSSSYSVGASGPVSDASNARRFIQYSGRSKDGNIDVDLELIKRDDATGTWTSLVGRDLGLDTRELNFSRQKQGDWKYGVDYNEIVRNDPYVIHTGMTGIGSSSPTVNLIQIPAGVNATTYALVAPASPAPAHDESLQVKRTALGLNGEKWISSNLQLELSFRDEAKKGARMFGRVGLSSTDMQATPTAGLAGSGALLLTPEPIDSSIRSLEAKLNFHHDKLALSGGYYGSFYTNNFGSLNPIVPGVLNRGALVAGGTCNASVTPATACSVQQLAQASVALPPDNQAHQLYFSGTYAYSDVTRTNFKLAYTHATQDESFVGMGLTPNANGPQSLGGVVDTTLLQLGLASRPQRDLSVNASFRYEDRADGTPINVYNYGATTANPVNQTTNWPSGSQTRTDAKIDATYRLTGGYALSAGYDWERKVTPNPIANSAISAGAVYFRPSLDENGLHAAVRKSMSETVNGAFSIEYKQRRGDDNAWVTTKNVAGNPLTAFTALTNSVLADMYMNRDRTKARASFDWAATERLTIEANVEHGQDDFKRDFNGLAATAFPGGARTMVNDSLTLDTTYQVSDDWRVNGYWTHSENRWNVNKTNLGDDTKNLTDTVGMTISGKVSARTKVGLDLVVTNDETSFTNNSVPGVATPALQYLPTIKYTTTKLNVFGLYELDKKSAIKVNASYQEFKTNDWQWGYAGVPFLYSDNTTVSNPNQMLTYVGIAYQHKF